EDGIRDYKVTGVQTCALPILCTGLFCPIMSNRPIPANQATLSDERELPVPWQWAKTPPPAKTLVSRLRTSTCWALPRTESITTEIGRASCRERGEKTGGAGSI